MISHRNVIANTLQINTFEKPSRDQLRAEDPRISKFDVSLGLLPQSHIYALVYICHSGPYRGDQIIILPKFEINSYLNAIQRFKINSLSLVSLLFQCVLPKLLWLNVGETRFLRLSSPCYAARTYSRNLICQVSGQFSLGLHPWVPKQLRNCKTSFPLGLLDKAMVRISMGYQRIGNANIT